MCVCIVYIVYIYSLCIYLVPLYYMLLIYTQYLKCTMHILVHLLRIYLLIPIPYTPYPYPSYHSRILQYLHTGLTFSSNSNQNNIIPAGGLRLTAMCMGVPEDIQRPVYRDRVGVVQLNVGDGSTGEFCCMLYMVVVEVVVVVVLVVVEVVLVVGVVVVLVVVVGVVVVVVVVVGKVIVGVGVYYTYYTCNVCSSSLFFT